MNKERDVVLKQEILNTKLAQFLKEKEIENLRLISLGNSLASGYSMVRTIKPLLLRNESIEDIMKENGINVERYHFSRAQNNSDEKIFEWMENNISLSRTHELNRVDYSGGPTSMATHGLTKDDIEKYYPVDNLFDIGLWDAIKESNKDLANIVIYNGATGSFLDASTRGGKISQRLMYGVNKDVNSIEATLKKIHVNNRQNNGNTQVYICGVPDFLGLKISELINHKLKKLTLKYSNTVYVRPIKSKLFYKELETCEYDDLGKLQRLFKNSLGTFDVHCDEEEYLEFNNNILKSIIQNYQIIESVINIDRKFYKLSQTIETENQELLNDDEMKRKIIIGELERECEKIDDPVQKKTFLARVNKYLIERFPYDFCYLGKEEINDSIDKINKGYQ